MRFVFADADFLPELAADVRYTPTFAVYQRGKKARITTIATRALRCMIDITSSVDHGRTLGG